MEKAAGESFLQRSSEKHSRNWPNIEVDPLAAFKGDTATEWKWLNKPKNSDFISGRLIGGCWDTLICLFETPFLSLSNMKDNNEEGLILYLENVEMIPCALIRAIHSMEFRGVFNKINGLVLGRNFANNSNNESDLTYLDVLTEHLSMKEIPIIYDVDIGHVPPNLTLFNGSYAEIDIVDGKGKITQWMK